GVCAADQRVAGELRIGQLHDYRNTVKGAADEASTSANMESAAHGRGDRGRAVLRCGVQYIGEACIAAPMEMIGSAVARGGKDEGSDRTAEQCVVHRDQLRNGIFDHDRAADAVDLVATVRIERDQFDRV